MHVFYLICHSPNKNLQFVIHKNSFIKQKLVAKPNGYKANTINKTFSEEQRLESLLIP